MSFEHGGLQWPFLMFKALLMNVDFLNYAQAKESGKHEDTVGQMESDFPYVRELYDFWGCVDGYVNSTQEDQIVDLRFKSWVDLNSNKLMVFYHDSIKIIHEGETITTEPESIYFTIPKEFDPQKYHDRFQTVIANALDVLDREADKILPVEYRRAKMDSTSKIAITERRLDAFYLKHTQNRSDIACVKEVVSSASQCWFKMRNTVEKNAAGRRKPIGELNSTDLADEITELRKLADEGQLVIKNTLLGKFPSYS